MQRLLSKLRETSHFRRLAQAVERARQANLVDVPGAATALVAAALSEAASPLVYVVPDLERAETELRRLVEFVGGKPDDDPGSRGIFLLPGYSTALYQEVGVEGDVIAARLCALQALARGKARAVVATAEALLQPCLPPAAFEQGGLVVKTGQTLKRDELASQLAALAYVREDLVTDVGQCAVRGGIVDFFPPTQAAPVRLELFGNEVESIRRFDPETQRSTQELPEVEIGLAREAPAQFFPSAVKRIQDEAAQQADKLAQMGKAEQAELLEEKIALDLEFVRRGERVETAEQYLPFLYDSPSAALDYLPRSAFMLINQPLRAQVELELVEGSRQEASRRAFEEGRALLPPSSAALRWERLVSAPVRTVWVGGEAPSPEAVSVSLDGAAAPSFAGRLESLRDFVREKTTPQALVAVATKHPTRTWEALSDRGVRFGGQDNGTQVAVVDSALQGGFSLCGGALVFLTDKEVFGWERVLRPVSWRRRGGVPLGGPSELRPGEYVVHVNHGIGRYAGTVVRDIDGVPNDYLMVEYAAGDRLYVPVTQANRLQRYLGMEEGEPTLHRLRGGQWAATKARVKKEAQEMAMELLGLYASREVTPGHPFGADTPWMEEMEASFLYEETPDQRQAVHEVKRDMEQASPMDRLVCGDVGFGKTEVAMRAAFKAVLDGRQVAVLAPTTVLVQQHHATFSERLSPYGVIVEMLSRFLTPKEQDAVLSKLAAGQVDVVIGTHRLLQKDVVFKDLGLVVVDEEQRFGVKHKEILKQLKHSVDVLTLTATPIPRTMHMALSGLRDMSLVNDPPLGRLPVRTFVVEESERTIREPILRELERGGQVYFVHNRVETIDGVARQLSSLIPGLRLCIAHGQMPERELEQVMVDFFQHRFDVLLCTTIIENGLDIPNVNTLIVKDADRLGLAQLYQLRGRVGRANRQAYAYLLYSMASRLSRASAERLAALKELNELGAGFRLALRDMEIRGTGNLLGPQQHGHIQAVGFELYCDLLQEAAADLRGQKVAAPVSEGGPSASLDLPLRVSIPRDYIPSDWQRLQIYRRAAACRREEELDTLREEVRDRFGPPPREVVNLLEMVRLRLRSQEAGVRAITFAEGRLVAEMDPSLRPAGRRQMLVPVPDKSDSGILAAAFRVTSLAQVTPYLNVGRGLKQ